MGTVCLLRGSTESCQEGGRKHFGVKLEIFTRKLKNMVKIEYYALNFKIATEGSRKFLESFMNLAFSVGIKPSYRAHVCIAMNIKTAYNKQCCFTVLQTKI